MNSSQLSAARRKLSFTEHQAASFVGSAVGIAIAPAQWISMERGDFPLPETVASVISRLMQWRESALAAASKQIAMLYAMHGGRERVALIDYASIDDWTSLPDRDELLWRPQSSVVKQLGKDRRVKIVMFDAPSYSKWLAGRNDDENLRSAWAAEQ